MKTKKPTLTLVPKTNPPELFFNGHREHFEMFIGIVPDYPIKINSIKEGKNKFSWEVHTNLGDLVTYGTTNDCPDTSKKQKARLLKFIIEDLKNHLSDYDLKIMTTMQEIIEWS